MFSFYTRPQKPQQQNATQTTTSSDNMSHIPQHVATPAQAIPASEHASMRAVQQAFPQQREENAPHGHRMEEHSVRENCPHGRRLFQHNNVPARPDNMGMPTIDPNALG